MSSEPEPPIPITLNPNAVAAPAQRAAIICREVIDLYFNALDNVDLSKPPELVARRGFFRFDMKGTEMSAEERRVGHETWILSKVFQDLMRGVRASLDEAYLFIQLLDLRRFRAASAGTLDDVVRPYREAAVVMKFPELMAKVNQRLDKPLEFADAYQSMQDARNCLEHRHGIVGRIDAKSDGKMVLKFPYMMMFVERNGERQEIQPDFYVEAGESIMMGFDLRKREFEIGQRLSISAADFEEIAFACSHFAGELARNLPKRAAGLEPAPD